MGQRVNKEVNIQAIFFEFQKTDALMKIGVGIGLSESKFAPNIAVRNYVNAQLLIDLFAVFDKAVYVALKKFKLKQIRYKSPLDVLDENGKIFKRPYLDWYKEWRNKAAHHFAKIEDHRLNQAIRDVKQQLLQWDLIKDYEVTGYLKKIKKDKFVYGAVIGRIPILFNNIEYRRKRGSEINGCSFGESINLSYNQFIKASE